MMYDVVIIGGGVSGLTAAYDLHRCGRRVVVLERQQCIGGNAISESFGGFLMEHGPTTLNAMVPDAVGLTREIGLAGQRLDLGENVRRRYLRDGDKLHGVSIHPAGFLLSPYLSWTGRLSVLAEIFRPRMHCAEDETVHAFAARRFGREFADKVMEPLVAGMFGGDSHRLSVNATFPKLKQMERRYGSVTRGVLRAKRASEPGKRLFSYRDGVGALPRALARAIAGSVKTGVAVKSVARLPCGYRVETHGHGALTARSVILAVQPHVAAGLLAPIDRAGATAASEIAAPPMSVVFLAFERDQVGHPLDSLGYLSTTGNCGIITGAQFCSTMFAGRAPKGHVSIAAYVGGCRNPDAGRMNGNDLVALVHEELSALLQIRGAPVLSRCRQWARSLPQYEAGHAKRAKILESLPERHAGLFVTGNYLAGVSVASCIAQARKTAKAALGHLAAAPSLKPVMKSSAGRGKKAIRNAYSLTTSPR